MCKQNLHETLKQIGFVDITDEDLKGKGVETLYQCDHNSENVHNILIKFGYEMATHTSSGVKMKPYLAYKDPKLNGANVSLTHKNERVINVYFNYRKNLWD